MIKSFFITGTGTDIGKTYVTALILKDLREMGVDAMYYKAAMSGCGRIGNKLIPVDSKYVCEVTGIKEDPNDLVSYTFENPVSPHLAAQIENKPIRLDKIKKDYENIKQNHDAVVVEGSGGLICPINLQDDNLMLTDIIKALELETIIIANAGLGTINDTLLTVEYARQKGIKVLGIVLNYFDKSNPMHQDNKTVIERLGKVPVVATVSDGDDFINLNYKELW